MQKVARDMRLKRRPLVGLPVIPSVSLPDDVEDDRECDMDLSGLPANYLEDDGMGVKTTNIELLHLEDCGCQARCSEKLHKFAKDMLKMRDKTQVSQDGSLILFHLVRTANTNHHWTPCGTQVCRTAFLYALNISKNRLQRIEKAIKRGHLAPFEDLRRYNGSNLKNQTKAWSADAFFTFLYQFLAEPMADEERVMVLVCKGQGLLKKRWLDCICLADFRVFVVFLRLVLLVYT